MREDNERDLLDMGQIFSREDGFGLFEIEETSTGSLTHRNELSTCPIQFLRVWDFASGIECVRIRYTLHTFADDWKSPDNKIPEPSF